MAIEFDLIAYIKNRPAVKSLVGDRVYAERPKQTKDIPVSLVFVLAGGDNLMHSQGASSLAAADIEMTCYGPSYPKARQLHSVVENELNGFRGVWGETGIDRCAVGQPRGATVPPTQGDEVGTPAVRATIEVHYRRPVPTFGET